MEKERVLYVGDTGSSRLAREFAAGRIGAIDISTERAAEAMEQDRTREIRAIVIGHDGINRS